MSCWFPARLMEKRILFQWPLCSLENSGLVDFVTPRLSALGLHEGWGDISGWMMLSHWARGCYGDLLSFGTDTSFLPVGSCLRNSSTKAPSMWSTEGMHSVWRVSLNTGYVWASPAAKLDVSWICSTHFLRLDTDLCLTPLPHQLLFGDVSIWFFLHLGLYVIIKNNTK